MRTLDALAALEFLGSNQWNLVTTAQASAIGITRNMLIRLTESGTLQRVRHGVYALPSAPHGPLQDVRAAWLATDPKKAATERTQSGDAVIVSGPSAAGVHGLGDVIAHRHEFTSANRRQSTQSDVRFRRRALANDEVTIIDGLPVTTVLRTLSDLARDQLDLDHLTHAVRDALEKPEVRASDVAHALGPHAAHFGADSGKDLLTQMVRSSSIDLKAADLADTLLTSQVEQVLSHGRELLSRIRIDGLDIAGSEIHLSPDVAAKLQDAVDSVLRSSIRFPTELATDFNRSIRKALSDGSTSARYRKTQSLPIREAEERS
ncbi:type IV toxin-antitoxin system AbiEi family antitoxin domain-containing protein [Microbacterium sp.]|uniref:type IV toxin-antitoxin system AbiEi family antitoxin domain-containing protein n=1 Tax=Microbacterium sp. TaxID=51671 RepID=UPI003F9BA2C8